MNSNTHSLTGLTYTYNGRVSTNKRKGYQGKGVSRTLFCYPNVADVPAELFACKVSQSPKPERQGKLVFKYLSFRFESTSHFNDFSPSTVTMDTDLNEVKNIVITQLASIPTAETSLQVKLFGKWKNIKTGTLDAVLYNDEDDDFQNADPMKNGEPPYFLKKDAVITVTLTGLTSAQGNDFLSSELSTTAPSTQVLQMKGTSGVIWDGTDNSVSSAPIQSVSDTHPTDDKVVGQVW